MKQVTLVVLFGFMIMCSALAQKSHQQEGQKTHQQENKVPPITQPVTCDKDAKPALLMVEGDNADPVKFKRYSEALQKAQIYEQLEGYYITVGDPVEVLEGEWPEQNFTVVARFQCKERAHQFWYSDNYSDIKVLREGAGDVRAMVYEEFAVPERIKWTN